MLACPQHLIGSRDGAFIFELSVDPSAGGSSFSKLVCGRPRTCTQRGAFFQLELCVVVSLLACIKARRS